MSYYIPTIIRETSEGTVRVPIADMMFQRREVWLTGEINSEVADAVIAQILHLDAEDPDAEITLYIDSPGGSVTAGLSIYDVMQAVTANIHTVCVGTAASMAAVLFAAGHRREILRHGEVMIHDPLVSGGITGSALAIQDKSDRLMAKRKVLCGILAQHTGKNIKQIYKVTAKDTYFGAEEAVQYGLADAVIEKLERRSA
jgi:ATP-dependent Clp protease protease subunit